MKVLWTEHALTQLDSIYEYIAQDSPLYARQLVDRLTQRSIQIEQFPNSGRRLVFLIQESQVEILAILHSATEFRQNLPSSKKGE